MTPDTQNRFFWSFRRSRVGLFYGLFAGVAFATTGFAAEPKVVVTIKPVHALVANIMAGVGTPTLIVDGTASPHMFTLKPSSAKAINTADVFIRVSEAVEPFTRKLVKALPKPVKLITIVELKDLKLLDQRDGATFEAHEDHHDNHADDHHDHAAKKVGDGKTAEPKDGHVWLDPDNAKVIVAGVTDVLVASYPAHAEQFRANAATLTAKLDGLARDIATELEPLKGKPFVIFHDATQYFETRFGVTAMGSITVSPDVQPSAKRLTAVRKKISGLDAVCVFSEPSFQPKLVAAVTEKTSARSGTLDAEGINLTPGPELYFDLMRGLSRELKTCLEPRS